MCAALPLASEIEIDFAAARFEFDLAIAESEQKHRAFWAGRANQDHAPDDDHAEPAAAALQH